MPDLFGAAGGVQQATQDADVHALRQVAYDEGKIKVQSEQVALDQSKLMLRMQQQIMERVAKMHQGAPGAPGAPLESEASRLTDEYFQMAEATMAFPEQSAKYAEAGDRVARGQAYVADKFYKEQAADMQLVSNLLEGVHDSKSFQAAAQFAIAQRPQMASMYGGILGKIAHGDIGYSKETVDLLKNAALKQTEQARIKRDDALTQEGKAREKYMAIEGETSKARERYYDSLAEKNRREGIVTKPPSAAQTAAVVGLMNEKYSIYGVDPSVTRRRALLAAERTAELMKGDPNMDLDTASRIAFREAELRGDYKGMSKALTGRGASPAIPLPLPASHNPKDLQEGRFYTNKQGLIQQWLGLENGGWGPPVKEGIVAMDEKDDAADKEEQEKEDAPDPEDPDYQEALERAQK